VPSLIRTPRKVFEKKVRFLFMGWWVDLVKEIIMKKLWNKIPSQYQGYSVDLFLF